MAGSKLFGAINIVLGIVAIIVQICWMAIYGNYQVLIYIIYDNYAFASAGLWGGIALIVSGILTLKLDVTRNKPGLLIASVLAGICSIIILALPSATISALGGTYDDGHAAVLALVIVAGSLGVLNNVALSYKLSSK